MQHIKQRPSRRLTSRTLAALVVTGVLVVTACSGDSDDTATNADEADEADEEMSMEMSDADMSEQLGAETGPTVPARAGEGPADGGFDLGVVGRDVIIELRVVVSSDDIQRSVASVMASASTLGGGLASSDVRYGTGDDEGFAMLVVKVPPEAVDRLLDGLDDTDTIQSINQSAQDVTEQLVDLDVRIENARTSVDNVREFMERTENLDELVSLEAELTRRQTELEQLEAQQRNIADRVAFSTVTIEIVPSESVPDAVDEDQSIGDAFRSGWDAFTAFVFGIGFVIAATLPFLLVGLVLAITAWLWVRRRDRRRSSSATDVPAPSTAASSTPDRAPEPDDDAADREPEPTH